MKMKDLLPEAEAATMENDNNICELCETHKRGYEKIPDGIVCPYCTGMNDGFEITITMPDFEVVGEHNAYEPEEAIGKYPVFNCTHCGESIALMPEKVIYNANHDVYYTGGRHYLNHDDEGEIFKSAQAKIESSLKQWVERYEAGDKVDTSNVALWIKRNVTEAIAQYLFEKGLKK